jgi:hypothetical protein
MSEIDHHLSVVAMESLSFFKIELTARTDL